MIEGLIVGILEQGLIYGIMAMGVYITYTILDFPDLSVDGTFPLGIAICFVMINNGLNPWLALLAAFAAGCIAGMFTGIFNVKLRIRNLLCGILTMTALYSINYGIVGKASDFLSMDTTTIFSQTAFLFGNGHFALYSKLVVILVITLIAKFALDWYMRTKSGFLLRSVGDNEGLVITLAQNPERLKLSVLRLQTDLFRLPVRCTANTAKRLTWLPVRVLLLWVLPPLLSARLYLRKLNSLELQQACFSV